MLIDAARSVLLIVDVQERLLPAMATPEAVVENCAILIKTAERLGVPVVASEQYPKGLGRTVAALAALIPADSVESKLHFSCAADASIAARVVGLGRSQIVLAGIETHVCVLQSALGFEAKGLRAFVAADATASRIEDNKAAGLARLRAEGVGVVTTEMVVFEWLAQAGTPAFKDVSRLIK